MRSQIYNLELTSLNPRLTKLIKPYEFWHPRVFEAPFYAYLGWQCLRNRLSIRNLAKANYALNHGEIGVGSKYESQLAFDQSFFMPTVLIDDDLKVDEKKAQIFAFIEHHGYPVILKSDVGCVGKGICKLSNAEDVEKKAPLLLGKYILQKFTMNPYECGVFFVRQNGVPRITGINMKHFPTVVGNGQDDLLTLARQHERFTNHWYAFLQTIDTSEVLPDGQEKRLSFIGSHTLGCKFTDDEHLRTPELEAAIFKFFDSQPGYNFGRVDVKCADEDAFKRGEFVVIEVNGVASLPTHMFDPKFSVWQAYKIFFEHARLLAEIAKEHENKPMELLSYRGVMRKAGENQALLNRVHQRLMGRGD